MALTFISLGKAEDLLEETVEVWLGGGEHTLNDVDSDLEALEPVQQSLCQYVLMSTAEDHQLRRGTEGKVYVMSLVRCLHERL